MKTIYLECGMGAAGDMLMSALCELLPAPDAFIARLNAIGIPGVEFNKTASVKCGITGTHIDVTVCGMHEDADMHTRHHHHAGITDIEHIIGHLQVSDKVKRDAQGVYRIIAEAESHAHARPVDEIHFHEVGTMDAIADIVGVCLLMEELAPDCVIASPVHLGSGTVRCAHGTLPVPAPATAYILCGIPVYGGSINGELCTPTGAALLKYFASDFKSMPVMRVSKIGCGMGTKDFEAANCLRAFLGETESSTDTVTELCCNIDDMTGEQLSFAVQMLFEAGALDVYTTPVNMKKGRPGILLTCMCRPEQRELMLRTIFKHTSTIGVREHICGRYILDRTELSICTGYGSVRAKRSSGWGCTKTKPEFEDMAKIAREHDISLSDIKQ